MPTSKLTELAAVLVVCFAWFSAVTYGEKIENRDTCIEVVKKIAPHDAEFRSRVSQKKEAFKTVDKMAKTERDKLTPAQLSEKINQAVTPKLEWGRCGSTTDWLWDLLLGATARPAKDTSDYTSRTKSSLKKLFTDHAKDASKHVVFDFAFEGLASTHAWVVYQFPNIKDASTSPRYMIFQSYAGVYNLQDWLTPTSANAEAVLRNRVRQSWDIRCGLSPRPKECKDEELEYLIGQNERLMKWLDVATDLSADTPEEIRDREAQKKLKSMFEGKDKEFKDQPLTNFLPAWKAYGGAKMLTKQELFEAADSWLNKLFDVYDWMNLPGDHDVTTDECKLYTDLFAARLSTVFPDFKLHRFAKSAKPAVLYVRDKQAPATTEEAVNKACVEEGRRIAAKLAM